MLIRRCAAPEDAIADLCGRIGAAYHEAMATESIGTGEKSLRPYPTPHGTVTFGGRCLVMGVLNVTPDSFSDGGAFSDPHTAARRALQMAAQGADVIDIGGESTRPGSVPVRAEEQIQRVVPVIRAARDGGLTLPVSVDTQSAAVAAAALAAGADIVNDVSGARADAAMPALLAERKVPFVVMHMQGEPRRMQNAPRYDDVVAEILSFLDERAGTLAAAGVNVGRMIVDPGIGFGKTRAHNLAILRSIRAFGERWPVLVGPSRKRFLGEILAEPDPRKRLMGTAAVVAHCALSGVDMVRVHDVREMRQVVEVCYRLNPCGRLSGEAE